MRLTTRRIGLRLCCYGVAFIFTLFGVIGCKSKDSEENVRDEQICDVYTLALGSGESGFDDDTILSAGGGGNIDGRVLVLVNGNPITFYSSYGTLLQINQYLKPGKNTIGIRGKRKLPIYLKIATMREYELQALVLKAKVPAMALDEQMWESEFDAKVSYELPIFKCDVPEDSNEVRKSVLGFLKSVHNKMADKDVTELTKLGENGREVWQKMAYCVSDEDVKSQREAAAQMFGQPDLSFGEFDASRIKLVTGKNIVMAYVGFQGRLDSTYLFEFEVGGNELFMGPARLVNIKDKWVWWD